VLEDGQRVGAIVVGAGAGRRFGNVEKAFFRLAGRPLLCWSVDVFERSPAVDRICLVVAAGSVARARELAREWAWPKVSAIVPGGRERQESVGAGLDALADCDWVLVHDAARPLVDAATIAAGLDAARRHGAAVAATPVRDTLKRVAPATGQVGETVDRTGLWAAQTPQVFRATLLREAFRWAGDRAGSFTDDAAMVAAAGHPVTVFSAPAENVKLTLPEDVPLLEALLRARHPDASASPPAALPRAGTGYDVHRLAPGRRLILGGVDVPYDRGLVGHSDGDALTHAVIDALLGACGLGDIGRHFPPGDPAYRDADSLGLLRTAVALARRAGWRAHNLDATVVCERPRLAPFLPRMAATLASVLEMPPGNVNVKAKTNEGLDAVGGGEAVAVQAIILIVGVAPPSSGGRDRGPAREGENAGVPHASSNQV